MRIATPSVTPPSHVGTNRRVSAATVSQPARSGSASAAYPPAET